MQERQIGFEIRTLDVMITKRLDAWHPSQEGLEELNKMQAWIIGYLYDHSDEAIFQKDVEAKFHIARSTATGILQVMEKKDLLVRLPYPGDARLKKLEVTEKGRKFHIAIIQNFERLQTTLKKGIPEEKLQTFFEVLDLIKENVKKEDFND